MATSILKDREIYARHPMPGDEHTLAMFYRRNLDFLSASGSVNPETDLDAAFWSETLERNIAEQKQGMSVRFLLFHDIDPPTLIGRINYSQIIRGPFQACYLGYLMDEEYAGRGYMTRAVRLTNDYMFQEMNIHRIMANYLPENIASGRVLEKLGFVREGIAKEYLRINGVWRDHVLTSLTNGDWSTLTGAIPTDEGAG